MEAGLLADIYRPAVQKELRPVVFLDRDGTIIVHEEVPDAASKINLLPGAGTALRILSEAGFLLIVVTNQPAIEKGLVAPETYRSLNQKMQDDLARFGVLLDAIYTCPHRYVPDRECGCRKPGLGLLAAAEHDFAIDHSRSWFVGDTTRDMETARRAGIPSILVLTGDAGRDTRFFSTGGEYQADDLTAAAEIITGRAG